MASQRPTSIQRTRDHQWWHVSRLRAGWHVPRLYAHVASHQHPTTPFRLTVKSWRDTKQRTPRTIRPNRPQPTPTRRLPPTAKCVALLAIAFPFHVPHANAAQQANQPRHDQADARAPDRNDDLNELLGRYFQSTQSQDRNEIAGRIKAELGATYRDVADALANFRPWPSTPPTERISVGPLEPSIHLTDSYDPVHAYSLLIVIQNPPADPVRSTLDELPESINRQCVVATIERPLGGQFHDDQDSTAAFPNLIRQMRRTIHLDTDRVYLYGHGPRGDRAFLLAAMNHDLLAGVLLCESTLDVPHRPQWQQLLLPSLRALPVHLVWTLPEMPQGVTLQGRQYTVAFANLSIVEFAHDHEIPVIQTVLTKDNPDMPTDPWTDLLAKRRPSPVANVDHWFRYPTQAPTRLVRPHQDLTSTWRGDQLDIRTRPDADRNAFILDFFKSKLAHLAARIENQTIHVQAEKCDDIDVLLEADMIDFDKPITVMLNGKRWFEGKVTPSIATLLDTAYDDWDFNHPTVARLRLRPKGQTNQF